MIDWRTDMENAPRDGTQVLLMDDGYPTIGAWSDGCTVWSCPGWRDHGEGLPIDNVTHWALINLPKTVKDMRERIDPFFDRETKEQRAKRAALRKPLLDSGATWVDIRCEVCGKKVEGQRLRDGYMTCEDHAA